MGIKYSEIEELTLKAGSQYIDPEILKEIPSRCDGDYGCGEELEFTDNLNQLYCPNRYCTHKIASRLEKMAKAMQADGWGISTCLEVVHKFKLISPFMVFYIENLPVEKYPKDLKVAAFSDKLANICTKSKRRVQLWEIVSLLNIPGVATNNARKIFDGYNTMESAYEDIEAYQWLFIAEKLGISEKSESGVLAMNIYETLLEYKEELVVSQKVFDIYSPEGDSLTIAITGGVQGFTNKQEFVSYLNRILLGKCNLTLLNTVNSKLNILIADNDTSSRKFKTATRLNEKAELNGGHKILICNHEECEAALRQAYLKEE